MGNEDHVQNRGSIECRLHGDIAPDVPRVRSRDFSDLASLAPQLCVSGGSGVSDVDRGFVSARDANSTSRSPRVMLTKRPSMLKPARPSGRSARRQPRTFTRMVTLRAPPVCVASSVEPGGDGAVEASTVKSPSCSSRKASPPRFSCSGMGGWLTPCVLDVWRPRRLCFPSWRGARGACRASFYRALWRTRALRVRP